MALTVKDILEFGPLKDAKLLAGESGINKEIKFVDIMDIPKVVIWLKGGELLLTSGYTFTKEENLQKRIVYDLAKKGVSAFGIKLGQFMDEVPQSMIADANNVGLPLIEVPRTLPFSEIMLPIFEVLFNEQYTKLKHAKEVHEQLFELLLKGGNFNSISELLSKLINNPVIVLDNIGNFRGRGFPGGIRNKNEFLKAIQKQLQSKLQSIKGMIHFNGPTRIHLKYMDELIGGIIISLETNNYRVGSLLILEMFKPLNEQDMMAIHHGSTITALEFSKERAVYEAEKRLGSELLEDLAFGNIDDIESIERRASFLKFNLHQDKAVFIVHLKENHLSMSRDKYYLDNLKDDLFRLTQGCFLEYSGGVLLLAKSSRLVGLAGVENRQLFSERIEKVAEAISKNFKSQIDFCIGVSKEYYNLDLVKIAYKEAMMACKLQKYFKKKFIFYEEIGTFKLLFELKDSPTLTKFYGDIIGNLLEYDKKNSTDLINTLETYFRNDCNIRKTSKELFVHNNSVLYRLQRIEELTGFDLKNPEHKLNLQMAIKAKVIFS